DPGWRSVFAEHPERGDVRALRALPARHPLPAPMSADPPRVLLLTDPAMERHATAGHPERHERLAAVAKGIEAGAAARGAELSVRAPQPADDEAITTVHDQEYLEALDQLDASGGGWIDPDTYLAPGSMHAARLAAGAAI